ncbi:MAG: hypothetical protein R3D59_16740 [Paracoccaceae bacterium]
MGQRLAGAIARQALVTVRERFGAAIVFDVVVVDRTGAVIARAGP